MPADFLPPIVTREFIRATTALQRAGCRDQVNKINAIQLQAARREPITAAQLTNHGESRLEKVEKFDLGHGYRAITQFIEHEGETVRVFWFAGSHDECNSWLERHRDHRYVYDPRDKRIELAPVDVNLRESARLINPELPPALLDEPLLRHLTPDDWEALGVSDVMKGALNKLTHADYANAVVLDVLQRLPSTLADVLFDVMSAANDENLDAVRARLDLFHGKRERATDAQVIGAIGLPVNAEKFLTFADPEQLDDLLAREAWEAWMLFVHPAQAEVIEATFDGPGRLRGVSGSGKSSIVLHRARRVARRYALPVLVITYTSSLAKLLRHLLDTLCGVEGNLITVSTTVGLAEDVLQMLDPEAIKRFRNQPSEQQLRTIRLNALRAAGAVDHLVDKGWSPWAAELDLDDALSLVRERYMTCDRSNYVSDTRPDDRIPSEVKPAIVTAASTVEAELANREDDRQRWTHSRRSRCRARDARQCGEFRDPGDDRAPVRTLRPG